MVQFKAYVAKVYSQESKGRVQGLPLTAVRVP